MVRDDRDGRDLRLVVPPELDEWLASIAERRETSREATVSDLLEAVKASLDTEHDPLGAQTMALMEGEQDVLEALDERLEALEALEETLTEHRDELAERADTHESTADRLTDLEATLEERLDELDDRSSDLETRLEDRIETLEDQSESLETELDERTAALEESLETELDERTSVLEDDIETRLDAQAADLEDSIDSQTTALETDIERQSEEFTTLLKDVRARVIQVKREADGKAPAEHDHDEYAETAALDEIAADLEKVEDRLAGGFENFEEILEHVLERIGALEERSTVLANAVLELRAGHSELVSRAARHERVEALQLTANRLGISTAKCADCGSKVDVSLLTEPACPTCSSPFADLEPKRSFFRSATLVTGEQSPDAGILDTETTDEVFDRVEAERDSETEETDALIRTESEQ